MVRGYLSVRATGGAAEALARSALPLATEGTQERLARAGEWFEIPSYGKKGLRVDENLQAAPAKRWG